MLKSGLKPFAFKSNIFAHRYEHLKAVTGGHSDKMLLPLMTNRCKSPKERGGGKAEENT